jgi:hypothetical protein
MRTAVASVVTALLTPGPVFAQAWVPPKGDGTVAIVYQNQLVRDHLFSDGGRIDVGHITSNSVLLDFAYGITDRLALDVNIPYLASTYRGPSPHPGSVLDNGRIHGTFQDFRVDLRYNVAKHAIVITPFVELRLLRPRSTGPTTGRSSSRDVRRSCRDTRIARRVRAGTAVVRVRAAAARAVPRPQ